jgi:hypothetical protein
MLSSSILLFCFRFRYSFICVNTFSHVFRKSRKSEKVVQIVAESFVREAKERNIPEETAMVVEDFEDDEMRLESRRMERRMDVAVKRERRRSNVSLSDFHNNKADEKMEVDLTATRQFELQHQAQSLSAQLQASTRSSVLTPTSKELLMPTPKNLPPLPKPPPLRPVVQEQPSPSLPPTKTRHRSLSIARIEGENDEPAPQMPIRPMNNNDKLPAMTQQPQQLDSFLLPSQECESIVSPAPVVSDAVPSRRRERATSISMPRDRPAPAPVVLKPSIQPLMDHSETTSNAKYDLLALCGNNECFCFPFPC